MVAMVANMASTRPATRDSNVEFERRLYAARPCIFYSMVSKNDQSVLDN